MHLCILSPDLFLLLQELVQYFPMARNMAMMHGPPAFPGAPLRGPFPRVPLRPPFHHFGPVPRMPMVSESSRSVAIICQCRVVVIAGVHAGTSITLIKWKHFTQLYVYVYVYLGTTVPLYRGTIRTQLAVLYRELFLIRGRSVHNSMWSGLQPVFTLERCPSFRVSFVEN